MWDEFTQKTRPETLLGVAVAGVALVALAGYLYLLKPSIATYRELAQERARALTRAEAATIDPAALQDAERAVAQLRERLAGGAWDVPREQMEAYVIEALDRISVRHDVELESVKPGAAGEVLMFDELPYDVRVLGGYFELFEWFRDVETELRPMVTKQFEMQTGEGKSSVALQLRLVAYRARESER